MALPPAGYCRHCHYLIPLRPGGRLEPHKDRGRASELIPAPCPGSRLRPPAETPTEVPQLAFDENPPAAHCQACGGEIVLTGHPDDSSPGAWWYIFPYHARADATFGEACPGSYRPPA